MAENLHTLSIHSIINDNIYLSSKVFEYYIQAATVCFNYNGFLNHSNLKLRGSIDFEFRLSWEPPTQNVLDSWNDLEEATEYGATAIAILIIQNFTKYKVIRRSRKRTGFDYWLGNKEDSFPFQNAARLEVSGILRGSKSEIFYRLRQKMLQINISDNFLFPGIVIIVEFSNPIALIEGR